MRTQNTHPVHREVIFSFALVALAVAGGTGWWTWQNTKPISVNQPSIASVTQKSPVSLPTAKVNPQVIVPKSVEPIQLQPQTYWLRVEGDQISLVPQQIALKPGVTAEVALTEALNNLLSNPEVSNLSSTIPTGTRLLSLRVTPGGIYVDLSSEFSQGGGTTSMTYRVAQIIYTATSLDPQAKVFLSVAGQPLDANHPLGGEGLILRQPITRQQFIEDFPIA